MKIQNLILASLLSICSLSSFAASGLNYVTGKITNITSVSTGLLVRIGSNEVPQHCKSGEAWMLVKQENSAMISMLLTAWTLGRGVVVYTASAETGMCQVTQIDPNES